MSLQIIFLGTAGSVPTNQRSLPAIGILRKGELILFDCGESVQRQMVKSRLSFKKKMKIFITHMHGDHVLGLPGLIQTMALLDRKKKLVIYGPKSLKDFVECIERTLEMHLTFPLEINEIHKEGLICEEKEFEVYTAYAKHIPNAFAFSLVEKMRPGKFYPEKAKLLRIPKGELWSELQRGSAVVLPDGLIIEPEKVMGPQRLGRKIVYSGDGMSSRSLVELAKNADLLIHECTFDNELSERATIDGHSTPKQATKTAIEANVKRLILTHISARYKTSQVLLNQAKEVFLNVEVAEDFLKIDLPLLS